MKSFGMGKFWAGYDVMVQRLRIKASALMGGVGK